MVPFQLDYRGKSYKLPDDPEVRRFVRDIAAASFEILEELGVGLCGQRGDHEPHYHESASLGAFRCPGWEADRLPGKAERARRANA